MAAFVFESVLSTLRGAMHAIHHNLGLGLSLSLDIERPNEKQEASRSPPTGVSFSERLESVQVALGHSKSCRMLQSACNRLCPSNFVA